MQLIHALRKHVKGIPRRSSDYNSRALTAEGPGSIPARGTIIPQAKKKKKKKKKKEKNAGLVFPIMSPFSSQISSFENPKHTPNYISGLLQTQTFKIPSCSYHSRRGVSPRADLTQPKGHGDHSMIWLTHSFLFLSEGRIINSLHLLEQITIYVYSLVLGLY